MRDRLYKDLQYQIFSYLSFHDKWELAQTSKYYYEIFKTFDHSEIVELDNKKFDINDLNQINEYVQYFRNIKFELDLSGTNVSDVSALGNLHTLNLSHTEISDVSALGNLHTLFLRNCKNVKRSDIEKLRKSVKNLYT